MKFMHLVAGAALALGALSAPAASKVQIDTARVGQIASWLPAEPRMFAPPASDRNAWDPIAASAAGQREIARAEEVARSSIPVLTDDMFLDFSKTGNRTRCQNVLSSRDRRVASLALAECLENKGRFIKPLCASLAAICSERTWVLPAHDGSLNNFHGKSMEMDLRATLVGWDLATCDYLLADKLPAETRSMIRSNVETRVLFPFREMIEGKRSQIRWITVQNNWNAVCLAGITGAALALERSPTDRAWYVAAAEQDIRYFLSGFTKDGYCSEGVSYWNYGYGRFLMLAELVRQNTHGKVDLLAVPAALEPALYALRSEVINGIYPSIADCHPSSAPDADLVSFVARRFGLQDRQRSTAPLEQRDRTLGFLLMNAFLPEKLPVISSQHLQDSPLRTWFEDGGVLICRPGESRRLAAVIKGGHNAEQHNHNDLGSFSVILGKTILVCDPGSEEYTARTFGSRRYESKVLNSYGHSVPVLGGTLQKTGRDARAVVLKTNFTDAADVISFDLTSAYKVPTLQTLRRTFEFVRAPDEQLVIRDDVDFSQPDTFATALITWSQWRQTGPNELIVGNPPDAIRVHIDGGGKPVSISSETLDEDVRTRTKPIRIGIVVDPAVKDCSVVLKIAPVES